MSFMNDSAADYGRNESHLFGNSSLLDKSGMDIAIYPTIKQPVHMIVIYSVAYSLVFLLGIVGNSLVVSVVYRNNRMHTVTNYFIVNLAVADILVCIIVVPITLLANLYSGWRFGAVMCKATPFLQGVAVCASVNTLTAIAFDRYLAICHTMEYKLTRKMARIIILLIWVVAGAIMAPWAVYYELDDSFSSPMQTIYICAPVWPSKQHEKGFFLGAIFLTCYTIPLVLISVCYTFISCRVWHRNAPGIANTSQVIYRSKVKVLKMLVVVVALFAFSWLPLYGVNVRLLFGSDMDPNTTEGYIASQIIVPISQWLGASNSCVNPIIYCFFSKKFRRGFTALVQCCGKSDTNYWNQNNSAYRSVNNGTGHTLYTSIRSMRSTKGVIHHKRSTMHRNGMDAMTFV